MSKFTEFVFYKFNFRKANQVELLIDGGETGCRKSDDDGQKDALSDNEKRLSSRQPFPFNTKTL